MAQKREGSGNTTETDSDDREEPGRVWEGHGNRPEGQGDGSGNRLVDTWSVLLPGEALRARKILEPPSSC